MSEEDELKAWVEKTKNDANPVPIFYKDSFLPLKFYDETFGLMLYTTDYEPIVSGEQLFVAGFEYPDGKTTTFMPESVFRCRYEAQRRLFEIKQEYREKNIMLEEVSFEKGYPHIELTKLHSDWYKYITPKFKIVPLLYKETTNEKAI